LASGKDRGQDFWLRNAELHLQQLGAPKDRIPELARGVVRLFAEAYQPRSVVPEDGPSTLAWLQEQDLVLGVVSNRQDSLAEVISALGLDWAFQLILAAGEVDLWKPDPALLLHAASLAGVEPKATMYVGDNYFADVIAARCAGMRPVLFDPMELFPEADCPVIGSLGELRSLVENMH
jgi:FMN phosphatase YigB (HAD superfamily)